MFKPFLYYLIELIDRMDFDDFHEEIQEALVCTEGLLSMGGQMALKDFFQHENFERIAKQFLLLLDVEINTFDIDFSTGSK